MLKGFSRMNIFLDQTTHWVGSGCGSVVRAVVFDTIGWPFESGNQQIYFLHLFSVNCIEKLKMNKSLSCSKQILE